MTVSIRVFYILTIVIAGSNTLAWANYAEACKNLLNSKNEKGEYEYWKNSQELRNEDKTNQAISTLYLEKLKEEKAKDSEFKINASLKRELLELERLHNSSVSKTFFGSSSGVCLRYLKNNGSNLRRTALGLAPGLSISDILGDGYRNYTLEPVEDELLNDIIVPIFHRKQKTEFLPEVLRGAFVLVGDDGEAYQKIAGLLGAYLRESSHKSVAPEYSIKLLNMGAILAGVKRETDPNGKHEDPSTKEKYNYATWFQLEGSPQWKELKKDPEKSFDAYWVDKMLGNPPTYNNNHMDNPVTRLDWAKHDLWDFPQYWASGKKKNIGPFGSSAHTENSNPLRP